MASDMDEMLDALEGMLGVYANATITSGVCMCGDAMDKHSSAMDCGHSPVDSGEYYAEQHLEVARTMLKKHRAGSVVPPPKKLEGRPLKAAFIAQLKCTTNDIRKFAKEGQILSFKEAGLQDALEFRSFGYDIMVGLAGEIDRLNLEITLQNERKIIP